MKLGEFTWVPVSQPLYVARTGMNRLLLGQGKTVKSWEDTLDAAKNGLEVCCEPERVYALGLNGSLQVDEGKPTSDVAFLVSDGVFYDDGGDGAEVYVTGETSEEAAEKARKWVTEWVELAKRRLRELDAD